VDKNRNKGTSMEVSGVKEMAVAQPEIRKGA
jgi:hypothetical protein